MQWMAFQEIEVQSLPVGHTRDDIDEDLSKTFKRLKSSDAGTLDDPHK